MLIPLLAVAPFKFTAYRFFDYFSAGKIRENVEGLSLPFSDNCFGFPGIQPFKPEPPAVYGQEIFYPVKIVEKEFVIIIIPVRIAVEDVPYFFEIFIPDFFFAVSVMITVVMPGV
jgi:hypothetical protein